MAHQRRISRPSAQTGETPVHVGPCDEQWLQEHILSQVPEGSFTGSIASDFWASVKTGTDPTEAAERVVTKLNRKGKP